MKKKALISSILTIAVCVSLIAGATFALFTDREDVNIAVTAGNVDMVATIQNVQLYSAEADPNLIAGDPDVLVDENGFTYKHVNTTHTGMFTNQGTAITADNTLELVSVTPGDKVTFEIKINNQSNVLIKWRTVVWKIDDTGLFDGLNITIGDYSDYDGGTKYSNWQPWAPSAVENDPTQETTVTVSVELPIDATNEYQGKTCKIGYRVEAVQSNANVEDPYTYEEKTNTYYIHSEAGMMLIPQILNSISTGEGRVANFKLTADMNMDRYKDLNTNETVKWEPISKMWVNFDGQNHTVSNLVCGTDAAGRSGFFGYAGGVTIENITFENVTAAGSQAGIVAGRGEGLTMENVTIAGTNYVTYNPDANLEETWGGVGAVIGVASDVRAADKTVTIAKDATVEVDHHGVVTEAKYNDGGMAYVQNINAFVDKQGTVTEIGEKSSLTTVSSVDELRAAINNASTDDKCTTVIRVAEGTYNANSLIFNFNNKNIVIRGMGAGATFVKAVDHGSHIFTVQENANVTFENIKMDGNNFKREGLYVRNNSNVTLINCEISKTQGLDIMIDEASDKLVNITSTVSLFSTTVEDVAMCAFPMVETHVYADVKGDSYVEFNYDANSKVGYIEKQNISKKPENMWINGDNSDPVGVIFFVKGEDNEARNEALQNALDTIQSDSRCWNKPVFVKLAAGEYAGNYSIKQFPGWNGTAGAGNSGNNYANGVPDSDAYTQITFIGQSAKTFNLRNQSLTPPVVFTGNVKVYGYGNSNGGYEGKAEKATYTIFKNVEFDATNSADEEKSEDSSAVYVQDAANNVSFIGCLFENATHITFGGANPHGVGAVNFSGCTFNDGGCISGGIATLNVENCIVVAARNGFINKSRGGEVTVTNCVVNAGRYFIRTSGEKVNLTATNCKISIYESEGTKHLVYFRGSNESAQFIDCTITEGYTTQGVDANSLLTIKNYNTFKHNIPGVQIYVDGVTHEVVLDKVSAEAPATLKIPEGVTTLGSKILEGNTTVKEVVIPETVTDFGVTLDANGKAAYGGMFYKSAVERIGLPEGMTELPAGIFNQAANLKKVDIPSTVTKIGVQAFGGSGLETLTVPATITEIGYGAFRDMKSLTSVTIEGDVDIPIYAFRACASLKNVVLNGKNVTFAGGTGKGMIFTNKQNGDGSGITIQVENEVIKARLMAADTAAKDYGGYTINCRMTSDIEEGGSAVEGLFKDKDTGALYAYNQTAYEAALSSDATEINVMPGTYTFKITGLDSTKTVICAEGTVFEGSSSLNMNGATVIGATFSNETGNAVGGTINGKLKNCTFTGSNGLRWCYAGDTVVFENCVFDGDVYGAHFDGGANKAIFRNCTFSGFNAFGEELKMLTLENCTFKANGRSSYNGINLHGNTELTGCTFVFDGSASTEWVDLCKNNKTVTFTNCVVTDGVNTRAVNTQKDIKTVVGNYGLGNTIIVDGVYVIKYDDSTDGVEETAMIKAAVAKGATHIWLADGNYTMPTSFNNGVNLQGKTLTIKGSRNAIIDATVVKMNDQFVTGANLTFDGVTLTFGNVNYEGFANTANLTYKNCQINGLQFVCGTGTVAFENCDLNSNGAEHSLWTWGISNISFTDCDFTYSDRAINCYAEHGQTTNATFTGCTFTKEDGKATAGAIETNSSLMTALNLTINNCTVNEGDLWWVSTYDSKNGANTIVKVDGVYMVSNDAQLENVLKRNEEVIKVKLLNDVSLNASDAYLKLGGEDTTSIEIDGNGKKLMLSTTYWSRLNLVNPNGVLKINNATVTSSQTSGTWNSYDLTFMCNVELTDVVFEKAVALDGCGYAKLTNVTITETHDYYALWISANVGEVTINGCTINSAGRGIKIDDQYVDADDIVCTKLSISNATFTTNSKAAIVVKAAKGAEIKVGDNVDISNVAADTTNAVWVDEDAAGTIDLVKVEDATVIVEP